ncbi:pyridoxamine 5'-phosphate oxidase family protein [Actinomadura sp. WMMB 499]|uniref:pyridoxamine 5'-phosphate oxidase family protein n=1 Tax=Actinomadura sp. WMMB 499 TaxID=1219491 RepID=UPI0012479E28|nr:pyridoxamine 5'-phosphate oxidase family protein [Actinomadura sp. WMMB 499]QFG25163.1 pyridoxamine 5'-phosphate oxidase family protein [Actinomadura sp. WMMB 499]
MTDAPATEFDGRFSDPAARATPWPEARRVLEDAELYWLATVRADGRPHVTPLIGVLHDGAMHFCTGLGEQKARNLGHSAQVTLTAGNNAWAKGLDVVVEGAAVRVTGRPALESLAAAYLDKYGEAWRFEVGDGVFGTGDVAAAVFRIEPARAFAFAKEPHGQTRYRFGG